MTEVPAPPAAPARHDLQSLARQVQALPPLPAALQAVLQAMHEDQGGLRHCITLIERDQALTAQLLRVANSAFYGLPGQVHRVADALRLLGLRHAAAVLGGAALQRSLDTRGCAPFDFARHWAHAMLSALTARALVQRTSGDRDAAFLAGLMHSLGQLVLAALLPEPTGQALLLARERHIADEEAEHALLGFSHRPLGALLLARWHLPEAVVRAVASPDLPEPTPGDAVAQLAFVVQTASRAARLLAADTGAAERAELHDDLAERARQLGLAPASLAELLDDLRAEAQALLAVGA